MKSINETTCYRCGVKPRDDEKMDLERCGWRIESLNNPYGADDVYNEDLCPRCYARKCNR